MALEFLSPLHKASRQISMYLEARTRALGLSPLEGHIHEVMRAVEEITRVRLRER